MAQAASFAIGPIDTVTVQLTFILAHVVRKDAQKHSIFNDVGSVVVDVVLVAGSFKKYMIVSYLD